MTLAPIQDNPVGWSSIYPPDRMGNPDPDVSPVASRALMSDVQRLGLLGRRGPVTGADLPAVEARGQGLMDNGMAVAGAVNPVGIRAFHGSPHTFDRFDMSKLGTGEGAQAYGHGLYFAGNEGVARSYRDQLAGNGPLSTAVSTLINGVPAGSLPELSGLSQLSRAKILAALNSGLGFDDWTKYIAQSKAADPHLAQKLPNGLTKEQAVYDPIASILEKIRGSKVERVPQPPPKGSMYEVNLRTSPERLLDWDKPLAGQPDAVQKAILGNLRDPATIAAPNIRRATERALRGDISDVDGGLAHVLVDGYKNPQNAAETLRKSGIDGIQYLDGGSRAAGEGSRNYVMFDDKLIDILRRYGLLGMLGGGAAGGGLLAQEPAQ